MKYNLFFNLLDKYKKLLELKVQQPVKNSHTGT